MGGIVSRIVENCKKLSKLFHNNSAETELNHINYPQNNNLFYTPPNAGKKFTNNKITSDNFKDYISITTKYTVDSSDFDKKSNFTTVNQKTNLTNLNSNYENISRNKNLDTHAMYSSHTFPLDKLKKITPDKKYRFEDFEILKLLGRGTFGKVKLVKNKKDNKLYAMKVLMKDAIFKNRQVDHTKTEREILEKIDHPFIVKLFSAFQTENKLYLVIEFMQGGDLFFNLKKQKFFDEKTAKFYACEIILALEHLHKNKIIYRDLKPENILLDVEGHIKLADFGLSKFFNYGVSIDSNSSDENSFNSCDKAFTLCGTPEYLAPEILVGKGYDRSVDFWSLGVLIFEMLNGSSPFKFRKNKKLNLDFYSTPFEINKPISEDAKNLIFSLLKINPEQRIGNTNLLKNHPFFKDINWEDIYKKKTTPNFIPKNVLKSNDDLSCFDKVFTDIKPVDEEYIDPNKKTDKFNFKNCKNIKDDFHNFSFTREDW